MKLIKQIDSTSIFINFVADKTFRTGVRLVIEAQAIIYKHMSDNNTGPADGKWKYDGGLELMDKTVYIGKRVLSTDEAEAFLDGNKAAGVDYLDKTIKLVEAEMEILGHDELCSMAGVIVQDQLMIQANKLGSPNQ